MNWKSLQFSLLATLCCCATARCDLVPAVCHVQRVTLDRWLISYEALESPLPGRWRASDSVESALFADPLQYRLFHPRRAWLLNPTASSGSTLLVRSMLRLPTPQLDRTLSPLRAAPLPSRGFGQGVQFAWASGGLFYASAFCVAGDATQGGTGRQASLSAPEPHTAILLALGALFLKKRRGVA